VDLPGILQGITEGPTPSESGWKRLLIGQPKVNLNSHELTLSFTDSYQWDWTFSGFQSIKTDKKIQTESAFTPYVKGILSTIKDLGIDEVYTSVGKNSLKAIFNPDGNYTDYEHHEHSHDHH